MRGVPTIGWMSLSRDNVKGFADYFSKEADEIIMVDRCVRRARAYAYFVVKNKWSEYLTELEYGLCEHEILFMNGRRYV